MYPEEHSCLCSLTESEAKCLRERRAQGWGLLQTIWAHSDLSEQGTRGCYRGAFAMAAVKPQTILSVKQAFLDAEWGQHKLSTGMIHMLLCTLSAHLGSQILTHVIELGDKALCVRTAFRLDVAKAV